MKRTGTIQKYLLADPLSLAAACVISLLFANATQQYLNTAKRNFAEGKSQTVVCFQSLQESPQDVPDEWGILKNTFQKQKKNNSPFAVTFTNNKDYGIRLCGDFNGLYQHLVWLPSIPIAHRRLII